MTERPMVGLLALLTPEQRERALAYTGPDSWGPDPVYVISSPTPVANVVGTCFIGVHDKDGKDQLYDIYVEGEWIGSRRTVEQCKAELNPVTKKNEESKNTFASFVAKFILNDYRGMLNKSGFESSPIPAEQLGYYLRLVYDGKLNRNELKKVIKETLIKCKAELEYFPEKVPAVE